METGMKKIFRSKHVIASRMLVSIALVGLAPNIAAAPLEEIVVTAERRTQSQQDVPLSITTITGDAIGVSGISEIRDVALKTPNLSITNFTIAEPQVFLRGVGTTSDSAGSDPTVSMFVDDVYIARSGGGSSDLFDLERIEILRGPQGTLYGRNATGGAISMFTKKPSQEFEAKTSATVGDYGLSVLRGYVNGPINEKLAGKLTFSKRDRDGYAKNIKNGQELDEADNTSARAQLLWAPTDATEVLFGLDYSTDDTNGLCRNQTNFDKADQPAGGALVPLAVAYVAAQGISDPRTCGNSSEQFAEKDIFGSVIRVEHDFDNMQLTSITGYRESKYQWLQELTGGDTPPQLLGVGDFEGEEQDQFSQEFRFTGEGDKLFWVAGLYYFNENVDRFAQTAIQFGAVINPGLLLDQRYTQLAKNTSYAVFGQLTYSLTDTLDLTLGGRQTWDEKRINQTYSFGTQQIFALNGLEGEWNAFTPRVTVDWKLADDHMLFFTYSEGYKSGLFGSQNTDPVLAAIAIEPEDATSMEIGVKTEWFDNRLRVNATVFDLEIDNLQLFSLVDFLLITSNGAIEASGLELDFIAAITDDLTVSGIYSSLDATHVGGPDDGKNTVRSPEDKFSISVNYSRALASGANIDFGTSVSYASEFFHDTSNIETSESPAATTWDASIRYTDSSEKWNLELWGKNLGDELITVHSILGPFSGSVDLYAPPKTVGVTFNYFWN
ncbi:MAG: iron complex outermembrane receptor protein [Chitinophagales bacterium]|jgi:iron complex outermembrane receptor protein